MISKFSLYFVLAAGLVFARPGLSSEQGFSAPRALERSMDAFWALTRPEAGRLAWHSYVDARKGEKIGAGWVVLERMAPFSRNQQFLLVGKGKKRALIRSLRTMKNGLYEPFRIVQVESVPRAATSGVRALCSMPRQSGWPIAAFLDRDVDKGLLYAAYVSPTTNRINVLNYDPRTVLKCKYYSQTALTTRYVRWATKFERRKRYETERVSPEHAHDDRNPSG